MVTLKKKKLNPTQELFCQYYTSDEEFFGNGVQSYIAAYKPKQVGNWYNNARSQASQLLTNTNILARINELLDIKINNETVDKNLGLVILQNADFGAKVSAIKEYNRVKQRVDDSPKVLMIGQILQNVESNNRTKTLKQGLPPANFLLDKEQEKGAGAVSEESSPA